jgi:hypothetical protein
MCIEGKKPLLGAVIHVNIKLRQAREGVKGQSVILVAIDVLEGDQDQEFMFQYADGPNKISVFCCQRHVLPVALPMLYTNTVVAAQPDSTLHYVVEGAKSQ